MLDYEANSDRAARSRLTRLVVRVVVVLAVLGAIGGWYVWQRRQIAQGGAALVVAPATRPSARPAAPARPQRPADELDRERHRLSQEVELLLANRASAAAWNAIPAPIRDTWIDASGKAWFEVPPVGDGIVHQRQEALKEALAGQTRVLYSGLPLLVDRRGRIWMLQGSGVRAYEGEKATDYPIEPVPPPQPMDPASGGRVDRVSVKRVALEDTDGNCWFVGGGMPGTWQMIRIRPDGTVDRFPIGGEMRAGALADSRDFMFIEQPRGTITLVAPIGSPNPETGNLSTGRLQIYRFNGSTVSPIQPGACDHDVKYVLPQENGSIKYLCSGGRFWTWWPVELLDTAKAMARQHVVDLGSPQARVRDGAMRALLTIGPQVVPSLPDPNDPALVPEVQIRLQMIAANAARAAEMNPRGEHSEPVAYDVGIELGKASPVARGHDGGVILHAANVQHGTPQRVDAQAMVWIDPAGKCSVRPLGEDWPDVDLETTSRSSFADATGRVYFAGLRMISGHPYIGLHVIQPDGAVDYLAPPGLEVMRIIGQDSQGRIYADSPGRTVVFDPSVPAIPWRYQYQWGEGIYSVPGQTQGWTHLPYADGAPQVRLLGPGEPVDLPRAGDLPRSIRLIPLKGRAILCEPTVSGPAMAMFHDGTHWHGEPDLRQLVRQHIAAIQPLAPQAFEPTEYGSNIAGNADRGLWLVVRPVRRSARPQSRTIEYFDGAQWHDVQTELTSVIPDHDGVAMCVADQGRALVLSDRRNRRVIWVTYQAGQIKAKPMALEPAVMTMANLRTAADPSGGVWIGTAGSSGGTRLIRADGVSESRPRTAPLLMDRDRRVWLADVGRGMLLARVNESWLEFPLQHLDAETRILQGPDGRLWLCQYDAISLIDVSSGPTPAIRQVGRWLWDGPKASFAGAFIDSENALWFDGKIRRVARYFLPETLK